MSETTNNDSGVEPPTGFQAGCWEDRPEYRIIYGTIRRLAGRPGISVEPTAIQLDDGRIDDGSVIEGPHLHVDGLSGIPLTEAEARQLAAAFLAAADELAALTVLTRV